MQTSRMYISSYPMDKWNFDCLHEAWIFLSLGQMLGQVNVDLSGGHRPIEYCLVSITDRLCITVQSLTCVSPNIYLIYMAVE